MSVLYGGREAKANNQLELIQEQKYTDTSLENILKFQNYFKKEKVNLVLGAGASMDSGLPSWMQLQEKIFRHKEVYNIESDSLWKEIEGIFNYQKFDSLQQMAIASVRYYSQKIKVAKTFESLVREILYPTEILSNNFFFELILKLFNENKIQSISTYNFDTLLDNYLRTNGISQKINHFHGILGEMQSSNDIVFTEASYVNEYNGSTPSNEFQKNLYKDKLCLFYGLSFMDPNQRRIIINTIDRKNNKRFFLKKRTGNQTTEMIFRHYLDSLNVKVIYIDKYNFENLSEIFF